ncbi:MAG: hypothetical protein DHS20C11_22630 [Lysobacteraceae bacterium]|nr:MAG: hypothetical protein DHS20C11_22630 [Xanthomonadaceae bacterium]
MKALSYLLLVIGFLGAAFVASLDPRAVNWLAYIPCIVVCGLGVFFNKKADHAHAKDDTRMGENMDTLRNSLANIVKNLNDLNDRRMELPVYEVRFDIDKLFRADLNAFADSRETISHRYGLKQYADVMSAFAAGERYINRVWSASTDGYVDEVRMYLDKAYHQFIEAEQKFKALSSPVSD